MWEVECGFNFQQGQRLKASAEMSDGSLLVGECDLFEGLYAGASDLGALG